MKKRKRVAKEVFIFIILLILVLLILAVALYDYIPTRITIAEVRKYSPDSRTTSIKQEIAYANGGDTSFGGKSEDLITSLKSYSLDSTDLKMYTDKGVIDRGNSNPFDYAPEPTTTSASGGTSSTNGGDSSSSSTNGNSSGSNSDASGSSSNSTTGTFFESSTSK